MMFGQHLIAAILVFLYRQEEMPAVMWHKRRIFAIVAISICAYMFLRNKNYDYSDERLLPNVKAEHVWEFIADFTNNKKFLIPHMHNFTINAESGNYDHWKYSVTYEETLPVWPYIDTVAVGHYSIRTEGVNYIVYSVHKTCFFKGLVCSTSKNNFIMKQVNRDTHYREEIVYECAPLFSNYCLRVADYTRQDYMKHLVNYFKFPRA